MINENGGSGVTHWFPGPLVPLRTIHVSVALLLRGPFRSQIFQTLGIVHHGSDPARDDLLTLDLPGLLAPLAALLGAGRPRAFHPHGRARLLAAGLRASWLQLQIAQVLIHPLIVAPSHAGHPSRLEALKR